MAKRRLVNYIRKYSSKGYPMETIKNRLVQDGWSEEEVNKASVIFSDSKTVQQPAEEKKEIFPEKIFEQTPATKEIIPEKTLEQKPIVTQPANPSVIPDEEGLKKYNKMIWIIVGAAALLIIGFFAYWWFFT